jgi:periplasmic protein TonB
MKKWFIILLIFFFKINVGVAQTVATDSLIIEKPDRLAEFQGGNSALLKFLQKNFKYPEAAQRENVSGRFYVKFIVQVDGSLSNFDVIKSVGFGVDEEAIRFLKSSPKWIPAKNKGKTVRSVYTFAPHICLSE